MTIREILEKLTKEELIRIFTIIRVERAKIEEELENKQLGNGAEEIKEYS